MLTVILADVPPCWEPISSARDSAGRLSALCARLHTLQTFPHRFHGESPLSTDLPHVPRCWRGWVWLSVIPGTTKATFGVLHQAPGAAGSLWNPRPFSAPWAGGAGMHAPGWGAGPAPSPRALRGSGELRCSLVPVAALEGRQMFCKRLVKHLQCPSGCWWVLCVGCLPCHPVLGARFPPSQQDSCSFLPVSATSAVAMT